MGHDISAATEHVTLELPSVRNKSKSVFHDGELDKQMKMALMQINAKNGKDIAVK